MQWNTIEFWIIALCVVAVLAWTAAYRLERKGRKDDYPDEEDMPH